VFYVNKIFIVYWQLWLGLSTMSIAMTRLSLLINSFITAEPTNPAAPVTKIVL
jgi:hypothetical protein